MDLWLRGQDSNLRPSGYEPDELPTAPPRDEKQDSLKVLAKNFFIYLLLLSLYIS